MKNTEKYSRNISFDNSKIKFISSHRRVISCIILCITTVIRPFSLFVIVQGNLHFVGGLMDRWQPQENIAR